MRRGAVLKIRISGSVYRLFGNRSQLDDCENACHGRDSSGQVYASKREDSGLVIVTGMAAETLAVHCFAMIAEE